MTAETSAAEAGAALPVVDFSRLARPDIDRTGFLAELRDILHDDGFFYLVGHGIAPALIAEVLAMTRRFFALPIEEKLDIAMVKSPHFRGYNRAGQERTRGEPDWREQLDINSEREPYPMTEGSPPWRRLQGPNQWPATLPALRPVLLAYQEEVTRLGIALLRTIAAALGQPEDAFARIYEPQPSQLMKIIRYPGREGTTSDQGVGAHRDGGFITLLLQDSEPGLRVRAADGRWIDALPLPGSFVVNTGELLELATNGYVHAKVHDVVAPPAGRDRYSVAFFLGSRPDAVIPVIDLPEELNQGQRGLSVDPLNPIFRKVGVNQLKSRLRSHPDVARAHYADLPPDFLA